MTKRRKKVSPPSTNHYGIRARSVRGRVTGKTRKARATSLGNVLRDASARLRSYRASRGSQAVMRQRRAAGRAQGFAGAARRLG